MIKRADASRINRDKATKEQIAENFKRLSIDTDKKIQLKPSILKVQKTLDGKTFGIIHENKNYYLKYTNKNGSTNPTDYKHLDSLNSIFGIEKFNSFEKANNKMSFICEAQNNVHKLRLLNEEEDDKEKDEKVTTDDTEDTLLKNLEKDKDATAPDMGGADMPPAEPAADMPPADMGGAEPAAAPDAPSINTTDATELNPKEISGNILGNLEKDTPAPEGGETPVDDMGGELPASQGSEETDPKKDFQEAVGKLGQTINDLQDSKTFDEKDVKNVMNSVISAIGDEGFKMVGNKVVDSFIKKLRGSQEEVSTDTEEPAEETPEETPIEEPETEKLDENFLKGLKTKARVLLKEQLKQEIEKRKRNILIESIKRKIK